jgi:hypothetical protein
MVSGLFLVNTFVLVFKSSDAIFNVQVTLPSLYYMKESDGGRAEEA